MPFAQMYCEMCSTYKILPCAVISLMTQLPSERKIKTRKVKKNVFIYFLCPKLKLNSKPFDCLHTFFHTAENL